MISTREIYEAARSTFIMDYNYQRKQVQKMNRKANADIEHAAQWRTLATIFDTLADVTYDKILYVTEEIKRIAEEGNHESRM